MALSKLRIAFKALRQLGLIQVVLYALYKLELMTGRYRLLTETYRLQTEVNGVPLSIRNLFTLPDRAQLAEILGRGGQRALIAEADEIAAGKFRMFGGELVEIKLAFNGPLYHWTHYETEKKSLSSLIFPHNDIKFIWEPARFGWAFTLGRAYHLTQDETYAETFWRFFEEFTDSNPQNMGPHWMNGQEVAIRLMVFVWASQIFETADASSKERRSRLAGSAAAHAVRIPPTLSYARAQNNNHLLSEAAGLYTAGLAIPEHPRANRWRRMGIRWLNWCFAHQIDETGEYIQHSTNYHRLVMQLALWVTSLKDDEQRFNREDKLASAARWLSALTDPVSGKAANLGANDGAYIFPLANGEFRDFRPVVQAASRAFLNADACAEGDWDEMSLWFGEAGSKPRKEADESSLAYPVIRGEKSWGMLRAVDGNLRLAHADLLHVDLWWRGQNIALDPGTYLYNGDPPWDNPWPVTRFHNTVTINEADQMTRAGRFMYLDWAQVNWIHDGQEIHASHDGYQKFGVRHHRTLSLIKNRWVVKDDIQPSDAKKISPISARLHWLLPDWEWRVEGGEQGVEISLRSPYGLVYLNLQTTPQLCNLHSVFSMVRAGEVVYGNRDVQSVEGWYSPTYGVKIPALSLAFEVQCEQSMNFRTEFVFPDES